MDAIQAAVVKLNIHFLLRSHVSRVQARLLYCTHIDEVQERQDQRQIPFAEAGNGNQLQYVL